MCLQCKHDHCDIAINGPVKISLRRCCWTIVPIFTLTHSEFPIKFIILIEKNNFLILFFQLVSLLVWGKFLNSQIKKQFASESIGKLFRTFDNQLPKEFSNNFFLFRILATSFWLAVNFGFLRWKIDKKILCKLLERRAFFPPLTINYQKKISLKAEKKFPETFHFLWKRTLIIT